MGSLALWGAVAGLGKGMMANAEWKQKNAFAELEAAREQKLREYTADRDDARVETQERYAAMREERGYAHDADMQLARHSSAIGQVLLEAGEREKLTKTELASREREGAADRQNRLDVADKGIEEARTRAGGATGKWKLRNTSRTTEVWNPKTKMPEKSTTPEYVLSSPSGVTYVQVGDQFVLAGGEGPPKRVEQVVDYARADPRTGHPARLTSQQVKKAEDLLAQNPDTADIFARRYRYLPLWFARVTQGAVDAEPTKAE